MLKIKQLSAAMRNNTMILVSMLDSYLFE